MIERLTLKCLPVPRFRYTQCVRIGNLYQMSGLIALDPMTGALEPGGPGAETAKILENLLGAMVELGLTLDHLTRARIYTTAFAQFPDINAAWEKVFNAATEPPARTAVGVSALPLGATVEMEFDLYKI